MQRFDTLSVLIKCWLESYQAESIGRNTKLKIMRRRRRKSEVTSHKQEAGDKHAMLRYHHVADYK